MKKFISLLLAFVLVLVPALSMAENIVKVFVEGKELMPVGDEKVSILRDDRTFVPLRAVSEALDYDVKWDEATKTITMEEDDIVIKMVVGMKEYTVQGAIKTMDVAPFIEYERTYVPIRFIAEAFGEKVNWDNANRVVTIGVFNEDKNDTDGVKKEFHDLKFGFRVEKGDFKNIFFKREGNALKFYDKRNHRSKEGGLICTVTLANAPQEGAIVVDNTNGQYILAKFVSENDYALNDPTMKAIYKESVDIVKDILETVYRLP